MNDKEDLWGILAVVFVIFAIWGGLIWVCANAIASLA